MIFGLGYVRLVAILLMVYLFCCLFPFFPLVKRFLILWNDYASWCSYAQVGYDSYYVFIKSFLLNLIPYFIHVLPVICVQISPLGWGRGSSSYCIYFITSWWPSNTHTRGDMFLEPSYMIWMQKKFMIYFLMCSSILGLKGKCILLSGVSCYCTCN